MLLGGATPAKARGKCTRPDQTRARKESKEGTEYKDGNYGTITVRRLEGAGGPERACSGTPERMASASERQPERPDSAAPETELAALAFTRSLTGEHTERSTEWLHGSRSDVRRTNEAGDCCNSRQHFSELLLERPEQS